MGAFLTLRCECGYDGVFEQPFPAQCPECEGELYEPFYWLDVEGQDAEECTASSECLH